MAQHLVGAGQGRHAPSAGEHRRLQFEQRLDLLLRHRLTAIAEAVNRLEERSDQLHDEGLKDLFLRHGNSNPMAYIIGSEIYGELEKVVDRFEDVVNEISGILIENL